MVYKARLSKEFLRKNKKLPKQTRVRVADAVKEILTYPHQGIPLVGYLKGVWRKRVGKYRILYEIDSVKKIVTFHDVGLRKKIYKR